MNTQKNRPGIVTVINGTTEHAAANCTLTFAASENETTTYYTMSDELYKLFLIRAYGEKTAQQIFNF